MNGFMTRLPARIQSSKLPSKESDAQYFARLVEGSRELAKAIMKTGKFHGPVSEEDQIALVAWAYDVKITVV
jgi:hypothetical protein